MRNPRPNDLKRFRKKIFSWYRRHKRALSWRETTDPYEILVSEVMLQQTQVSRVREKLPAFLKTFPSFPILARATASDVVRAWHGMGYNSRAVRLRDLARAVETDFGGRLPDTISDLQSLPGIGPYTAHAVSCFAMQKRVPLVDVNIRRVFSRIFWTMKNPAELRTEREVWEIARQVLPRNAYVWNQALMDLGATICSARKPLCDYCPVAGHCSSRRLGRVSSVSSPLPAKRPEPMYDGIPQRIWRGKIVQKLRALDGTRSVSVMKLGKSIRQNFRRTELPWLVSVVDRLHRDGIVAVRKAPGTMVVSLLHE